MMTMKQLLRTVLGATLGTATFLVGQPAVEFMAWWFTGGTATFDDPLINAVRIGLTGSLALAVALMIGLQPRRSKQLL